MTSLTDDQRDSIIGALIEGYGVEDIAVDMKLPLVAVRDFVFSMPPDLRREICRGEP